MAMQQREPVRELARGKWAGLLAQWLDPYAMSGKHAPCPICKSGKDKFRFDDLEGAGTWICNTCGAGDGIHLLQQLNDWTFKDAARHIEQQAGRIESKPSRPNRSDEDCRESLRRVWAGAQRIDRADPAGRYLFRRCAVEEFPNCLRFHPDLPYLDDDGVITRHPAMLAQVLGADDVPVTIHRTYLTADGRQANVKSPKKLMTPIRKLENVAIRLRPIEDGWLGVAEGIETAYCAEGKHGAPVWACVSAGLLKTFRPPPEVKLLAVMGDNDASFTGQSAAYELARLVRNNGLEVKVLIPEMTGEDWADVAQRRRAALPEQGSINAD